MDECSVKILCGMMVSENASRIAVRDAEETDVPALTAIKGDGTEVLHRDRLRDAEGTGFRYLVLEIDQVIIGFACLVIRRPEYWSDASDAQHLPQIVDLQIKESQHGQGYGSNFVRAIERIASQAGYRQLYVSVELLSNARAHTLYQRLGYQQEQSQAYQKIWKFHDSEGKIHSGEDWVVDMVKQLQV